jgi:hypothetical protein
MAALCDAKWRTRRPRRRRLPMSSISTNRCAPAEPV